MNSIEHKDGCTFEEFFKKFRNGCVGVSEGSSHMDAYLQVSKSKICFYDDGWKFNSTIEMNYCPMCGVKLGDKK